MASYFEAISTLFRVNGNTLKRALYTAWYAPYLPVGPPRNYTGDLIRGYMDNELVYSIVSKIARVASDIPLRVVDVDGNVDDSHWVNGLLEQANADMTFKEFLEAYYIYLLSIGNSFVYAPFMDNGRTVELWIMPSDLVQVIAGPFYEPINGYKLLEGNQEIRFERGQVMHGKLFNPRFQSGSWVYGLSPVEVAIEVIKSFNSGITATESAFRNMGPPYIISSQTPEGLTQAQQEMLEEVYKKKYGNPSNAGKPMLTGTPVRVERLGVSPVDLAILEHSRHALRILCNIYGVNSILFNDVENSTYNNIVQAEIDLYQHTIMSLNSRFAVKLKQFLIPGEPRWFKFDYSDVQVLQDAQFTKALELNSTWELTPNEKRIAMGYAPMDDPLMDKIYKPFGTVEIERASKMGEQKTGLKTEDYPKKMAEQVNNGVKVN